MADNHGAAYNHSPEVNAQSGSLPWQATDNYGGYGSQATPMESHNDGDNDTDDVGSYPGIPATGQFMTERQRGFQDSGGGWS
jgi:hypothetical protein